MILPGGVSSVIFELTGETAGKEIADWLVSNYRRHNLRYQTPPISPSTPPADFRSRQPVITARAKPSYPLARDRIRSPTRTEICTELLGWIGLGDEFISFFNADCGPPLVLDSISTFVYYEHEDSPQKIPTLRRLTYGTYV